MWRIPHVEDHESTRFFSRFCRTFPLKTSCISRDKSGTSTVLQGNIRRKIPEFPLGKQLPGCTLAYSFERFYVGTCTSPAPGPARPGPILARPTIQARPSWPTLPPLSCTCDQIFPWLSNFFFSGQTAFFLRVRKRGKNSVQKEKTHLLH